MKRLWAYLVLFGITEIILNCTIAQAAPITISNPFPLSQTVDRLQQVSITVSSVAGGKSPYTYQWLDTVPGSATFSSATICVNPHSLTCFFNTSESTVTGNYRFKLQVTDKKGAVANSLAANVIINTKLMAGSVTPPAAGILQGDSITLQANPSGGTPPYVYQWYSVKNTSPCATAGIIISGAVLPTYNAAPTNSIYYCYRIADSATTPVYNYSGTVLVTVTPRISTTTVSTVSTTSAVTSTTTETSTTTVSTSPTTSSSTSPTSSPTTAVTTSANTTTTINVTTSINATTSISSTTSINATTSINTTTTTGGGGGGGVVISGSGGSGVLPPYGGLVGAPESTFELFSRPNGFYIANVVEYNHLSIDFDEKTFDLIVHSVGPEYSSVTIDNTEYNLYQNVPVIIGRTASDIYYLVVENMTFARPQGTLEFSIFKLPNVTFKANTTVLSSQSPMANVKVPNSHPILLNAFGLGTVLNVRSSVSSTNATLQIQNMTAYTSLPSAPFGYVRGTTLNISAVSAGTGNKLLMNVTSEYDCINGNSTAIPFALYNNSWSEILPFSVNSTSCDVTYPLKGEGVVALMLQQQTTAPQGGSAASTTQPTSDGQLQTYYYAIAILITLTGVVLLALRWLEAAS